MNYGPRLIAALLGLSSLAAFAPGCIFGECAEQEPGTTCFTIESATRYEGQPIKESAAWTAGTTVRIVSANGKVTVRPGSSGEVEASFVPFILEEDGAEGEERAVAAMKGDLDVSVTQSGDEIVVRTSRNDGAAADLGADVTVSLPSGFDGAFVLDQNNGSVEVSFGDTTPASTTVRNDGAGSVSVSGAAGQLDIATSTGDIELSVASWSLEDGTVFADNGDIELTVPANVDGTMVFSASGQITEGGIPETWASSGEGSYTMNSGAGGQLTVTADFGDISLLVD